MRRTTFNQSCASREFRAQSEQLRGSLLRVARAYRHHAQLKDIERFDCWMFSILNNCWREHLRRLRPHDQFDDLDELVLCSSVNVEDATSSDQISNRVRVAVSELPLGQRQVITLVDLQGYSYADVATSLEIPTGTVMSRLSRARQSLKEKLLGLHNELKPQSTRMRIVK